MIYMLDTANIEDIRRLVDIFPISGVTTNPSIIAKENRPFADILRDIREATGEDVMLHAQVLGKDADIMVEEGRAMSRLIGKNFVVKIPVTDQGIKAVKILSAEGMRITATAILSPQQALMAAMAGAEFLAPYVNRLDNICGNGVNVAAEMVHLINEYGLNAKVLGASFKNVQQVHELAMAGAHSVTLNPETIELLLKHPLTDSGVSGFVSDWEGVYGEGKTVLDML